MGSFVFFWHCACPGKREPTSRTVPVQADLCQQDQARASFEPGGRLIGPVSTTRCSAERRQVPTLWLIPWSHDRCCNGSAQIAVSPLSRRLRHGRPPDAPADLAVTDLARGAPLDLPFQRRPQGASRHPGPANFSATLRNFSSARSKLSTISAATSAGAGNVFGSVAEASLSQVMSRFSLSRRARSA